MDDIINIKKTEDVMNKYLDTKYKTKKELKQNIGQTLRIRESWVYPDSPELVHENGIENYVENGEILVNSSFGNNNGWNAIVTMENGLIKKVK
jgi:hypothetical protein